MNSIAKFIESGSYCPCCRKDMTLFMQIRGSVCLKAMEQFKFDNFYIRESVYDGPQIRYTPLPPREFMFNPVFNLGKESYPHEEHFSSSDTIEMITNGRNLEISACTHKIQKKMQEQPFYLFYLCNEAAIKDQGTKYSISASRVCSQKSSCWLIKHQNEIKKQDEDASLVKAEVFSFQKNVEDFEKTYVLDLDYEQKMTKFYSFSVTQAQKNTATYRPKVFTKELPPLPKRPDFSNKESLFQKFESWIIMS